MTGIKEDMLGKKVNELGLVDHDGETAELSQTEGKKVLLSFHPMAWTSICADQMLSLENNYDEFIELDTIPFGISVDTEPSKKAWAKHLDIQRTRLLSDFWPHGEFARELDLFDEKGGTSMRANVVLNENNEIIFFRVYEMSKLPDIGEILEFLRED